MKDSRQAYRDNLNRIDAILNGKGNPNRDKIGRFSTGPGGGSKSGGRSESSGETSWKPFGTKQEAESFSKGSKVTNTLYHGTNDKSAKSIKKNGFNIRSKAREGGSNFPGVIMFESTSSSADFYADRAISESGGLKKILSVKINAKKLVKYNQSDMESLAKKDGVQIRIGGSPNHTGWVKGSENYLNSLFKDGADAVEYRSFGSSAYMIKDKRNIMVFDN